MTSNPTGIDLRQIQRIDMRGLDVSPLARQELVNAYTPALTYPSKIAQAKVILEDWLPMLKKARGKIILALQLLDAAHPTIAASAIRTYIKPWLGDNRSRWILKDPPKPEPEPVVTPAAVPPMPLPAPAANGTGDQDAALELAAEVQNDMNTLFVEFGTLQHREDELETALNELRTEVAELLTTTNRNASKVAELKGKLNTHNHD